MVHILLYLFLLVGLFSFRIEATPEQSIKRIQSFILIGDLASAVNECQMVLKQYPEDSAIFEWAIKSFARAGREDEMMRAWYQLKSLNPIKAMEPNLLEEMCWGVLQKGKESSGLSAQLIAIIGAALTQDIRALPFLLNGMRHQNAQIREITVELAAHYGDYPLRDEIKRLFCKERVVDVQLVLLKAIGQLQMDELLPDLVHIVADPMRSTKEKGVASEAIVEIKNSVSREELHLLASNRRVGLRQLACRVIAHCHLKEESEILSSLIQDSHAEVRASALQTWGLLRNELTDEIKKLALSSADPEVGITASWVWLMQDPEGGESIMAKWLQSDLSDVRTLAASAIAKAGPYGIELAKKFITLSPDPYVKLNLSLALVGQRESIDLACQVIEQCLESRDRWMATDGCFFKTIKKSMLSHKPHIVNYPEVMNQTIRLELLNLLAILESPHALTAIKEFLLSQKWGISGLAAEMLLGEGDESAIDLIRQLLTDADKELRLEAALALAMWGKDYSALPILLEVYPHADRQLKLKILESLGRIGDKTVIPFLIEKFQEPSLLIRMVAASVLIQILHH